MGIYRLRNVFQKNFMINLAKIICIHYPRARISDSHFYENLTYDNPSTGSSRSNIQGDAPGQGHRMYRSSYNTAVIQPARYTLLISLPLILIHLDFKGLSNRL